MNITTLRRKRVIVPAIATVAVLAVGGTVWSANADDVKGDERDRVATAATSAVGGGEAVDVETSDDWDDRDDRALTDAERAAAEKAALAAVGGGTVREVEASDDRGAAYDVEVLDANGAEWDVDLDARFKVLAKVADN